MQLDENSVDRNIHLLTGVCFILGHEVFPLTGRMFYVFYVNEGSLQALEVSVAFGSVHKLQCVIEEITRVPVAEQVFFIGSSIVGLLGIYTTISQESSINSSGKENSINTRLCHYF